MSLHTRGNHGFTSKDDYETPKSVLELVLSRLDPNKVVLWEPFVGTGRSTRFMRELGFDIIENEFDNFFETVRIPVLPDNDARTVVLVTNPPFSIKDKILQKLQTLQVQRFALLLPATTLHALYWNAFAKEKEISLIIPSRRIKYLFTDGRVAGRGSFESLWCLGGVFATPCNCFVEYTYDDKRDTDVVELASECNIEH